MSGTSITKYKEDEVIVEQGDKKRCLYKILSGNVALYLNYGTPGEYLVGILSFPQCFGEMTVLTGRPSIFTVIAQNNVVVMEVHEDSFESFIQNNYQNAMVIMQTMAKNFQLLSMNMNMLLEELNDFTTRQTVDVVALKELLEKHTFISKDGVKEEKTLEAMLLEDSADYSNIIHPEHKKFLAKAQYSCPHCKQDFEGTRIIEQLLLLETEESLDMRKRYVDFIVEWHALETCPHCYYTSFRQNFAKNKIMKKEQYEEQLEILRGRLDLNFKRERNLNFVIAQYFLALVCMKGSVDSRIASARIWANLAWLYEDAQNERLFNIVATKAIEACREACGNSNMSVDDQDKLCLVAASMASKLGKEDIVKEMALKILYKRDGKAAYKDMVRKIYNGKT